MPVHIDNASKLHVPSSCTYSERTKHLALQLILIREQHMKKWRVTLHYSVITANNVAEIGIEPLGKQRHLHMLGMINNLGV